MKCEICGKNHSWLDCPKRPENLAEISFTEWVAALRHELQVQALFHAKSAQKEGAGMASLIDAAVATTLTRIDIALKNAKRGLLK